MVNRMSNIDKDSLVKRLEEQRKEWEKNISEYSAPKSFTQEFKDAGFDINNPEKELTEYESAFKKWKKAKKNQMSVADDYYDAAKEYNRLSREFSEAEKNGNSNKCNFLLGEIQEAALELEQAENNLNCANKEVDEAEEMLQKEKDEAKQAADRASESGDDSRLSQFEAIDSVETEFAAYSDRELSDKLLEAKDLIKEADLNMKRSLEKMKGNIKTTGHQSVSAMKAMTDPNGNGGLKVLEAAAIGVVALSKSAMNAINSIQASIAKREATNGFKNVQNEINLRYKGKFESETIQAEETSEDTLGL